MAGRSPGHLRFDGRGWTAETRPAMTEKEASTSQPTCGML
jgi:hypothetical protein